MFKMIRYMTRPGASARILSCQPTYVPSVKVPDMSSTVGYVIKV
ncbi:unnamed protein product [Camellia sinensis]